MRESNYWLRLISSTLNEKVISIELTSLLKESDELKKILGAIVAKSNK